MKICVTAQGDNLDAKVDMRFGRCQYFIIVDPETLEFKAVKNPNMDSSGGAGIQSGKLVVNEDIKAVLTGNTGPNAYQVLQQAGIKVFIGISGTVRDAILDYKQGKLKELTGPSVDSHFGMK